MRIRDTEARRSGWRNRPGSRSVRRSISSSWVRRSRTNRKSDGPIVTGSSPDRGHGWSRAPPESIRGANTTLSTERSRTPSVNLKERCLRAKCEGRSAEDAAKAYAAIHRSRSCRTWTDNDGAFRLDALLTPDAGATLLASLTKESDRIFQQARKAGLEEPPTAYAADALVALVTGQPGHVSDRSRGGRPDAESGAPPVVDARSDRDDRPGQNGRHTPSATVHLRVDLDALRRGSVNDGDVCEIPGVGPVPIESARALMGDAITDLVITNGVDVTTVCHLGRSIPRPLRTALMERDRTCVVPGCDVRRGLEIDHWQISFVDGGPATLENLARLCGHHHYLRTHQGFELHGGPGRWRWRPPKTPKMPKAGTGGKGDRKRRPPPLRT